MEKGQTLVDGHCRRSCRGMGFPDPAPSGHAETSAACTTRCPASSVVFHFVPPRESLKSAPFFRTSISSVTPVRSLTCCAEPTRPGFIPPEMFVGYGNKMRLRSFTLVLSIGRELADGSFEQLAM